VSGGALVLDGVAGSYLELAAVLLSGLTAVTFDFWATFGVNADNCRVFDFGNTNFVSAFRASAAKLCVLHAARCRRPAQSASPAAVRNPSRHCRAPAILDEQSVHVTVCGGSAQSHHGHLYQWRASGGPSTNLNVSLASLNDELCWIGRSLFAADPYLNGSINELRIYRGALSAASVQQSELLGPDQLLSNGPVDIVVNPANASVAVGQTAAFPSAPMGRRPSSINGIKMALLFPARPMPVYSFPTVLGDNGATFNVLPRTWSAG
jgi:hypothetical protein